MNDSSGRRQHRQPSKGFSNLFPVLTPPPPMDSQASPQARPSGQVASVKVARDLLHPFLLLGSEALDLLDLHGSRTDERADGTNG